MRILVLNAGSSSVKYQVFSMAGNAEVLTSGLVDRIGEPGSEITSHHHALEHLILHLQREGIIGSGQGIDAIGHRVVHGG